MSRKVTYVIGEDGVLHRTEEPGKHSGMKKRIAGAIFILFAVTAGLLGILFFSMDNRLSESYYQIQSDKLSDRLRIILLSDLHLREFGENNAVLVQRISELKPDMIAMAGDMNDEDIDDYSVVIKLCSDLVDIAPVYYVPGNHEWNEIIHRKSEIGEDIKKTGVHFFADQEEIAEINGNTIRIGGLAESPSNYEKYGKSFFERFEKGDEFKLLLVHYPEYFEDILTDADIDLALCGHAHGGQIRIPGIGGLYTKDQGWFPKLTEGVHSYKNASVVISRGMGNNERIPRLNNPPELVIVDMNWY